VNSNDGNDFENEFGYTSAYEWIVTPNGQNYSGAIIPVLDPDPYNATNRVLRYRYYGLDMGIIRLADNYADAVTDTKLTVDAGETYQVKFKWKTEGNAVADTPIIFGVGLATYDFADQLTMDDIDDASKSVLMTLNVDETGPADWQSVVVNFTAPATLPEGKDQLVIWVTGGKKAANNTVIYFDDFEVASGNGIEEIQYVIKLDTRGGEKLPNLVGSYGVAYTLPKEAKKEGYKFLGWYTSSSFTTPAEDGIFTKESMTFYAKFVRNQSMNSFEEQWAKYPVVASDWFDSNLWYNTSRTIDKANSNWTSADAKYQFNAEGVRTGTGSIYSPGVNEKDAVFTFLLDEPLTIGETYTLSFWIKLNDYTEPGDIKFWYNNGNWNSGLLASPSGWDATIDRSEVCLNTSALSNNVGEWVEYRCNFVPKGYFAGLSIPAFTSCYIDDVVITSSYADETYDITAAGTGKVFEDWFNGDFGGVEGTFKPVVVTPENTVIDYADLPTEGVISGVEVENPNADKEEEKNDGPTYVKKYKDVVVTIPGSNSFMDYLWIIIAGGAVVLAGVAILVVVLIKKRNRKNG